MDLKAHLQALTSRHRAAAIRVLAARPPEEVAEAAQEWAKALEPDQALDAFRGLTSLFRRWKRIDAVDEFREALATLWHKDFYECEGSLDLLFRDLVTRDANRVIRYACMIILEERMWDGTICPQTHLEILSDPDPDNRSMAYAIVDETLSMDPLGTLSIALEQKPELVHEVEMLAGDEEELVSYSEELEQAIFQALKPLLVHPKAKIAQSARRGIENLHLLTVRWRRGVPTSVRRPKVRRRLRPPRRR